MTGPSQYLLVLYLAEQQQSTPVSPGAVAAAVGRSPAATTEMLKRLEMQGLLVREPYEGVTLTPDGRAAGKQLFEAYVVLSVFFRDVLGIEAHESEAMQIAGTIDPAVIDRIESTLLADDALSSFREQLSIETVQIE